MCHQGDLRGGMVSFAFFQSFLARIVLTLLLLTVLSASAKAFTATTLGDFGNVTVMEVEGSYDAQLPDGTINAGPRRAIAQEFFNTHLDEYDFLIIFSNFEFQMPPDEALAFYQPVKNDIQGIGQAIFDHTALYGSASKLQGTVDMGTLANDAISSENTADYEFSLNILSHEILHRWSAFINFEDESGKLSDALLGNDGSHWSNLLDTNASLQYGNDWRDNGDGTFTSVGVRTGFSPLDLYLMGMIDKSQVPPMLLIENSSLDPTALPELGQTVSGTARTVTIEQIIAAMGERVPSSAEAQKSFNAAFIFVTRPGTFLNDDLYSLEKVRNGLLTRFSILTDGEALVRITPQATESLPSNPGVQPPSTLPRTAPPKVEDGVNWLIAEQREDGSWFINDQTMERDTAESVSALDAFVEGQNPVQLGLGWLNENPTSNTDYLARRIEAIVANGGDATTMLAELAGRQNSDGGWGLNSGFVSNPADTGLALKALSAAGYSNQTVVGAAITYLQNSQNQDGGWSAIGSRSLIQPTAYSLLALNHYRNSYPLAEQLHQGTSWLASKQNIDGGFGNSPSTVYDSAVAVLALAAVKEQPSAASEGVGYLLQAQGENGSWNGSPYQTAAAIKAVWEGTINPDLTIKAEEVSFVPTQVVELPTNATISAQIWNNGRTDIPQTSVELYRESVQPQNLIDRQTVAVPGLTPVVLTFADTIETAGEHSYIVVVDPDGLVDESDETNNQVTVVLYPEANHDFVVQAEDLSVSSRKILLGESVDILFTVYNRGTEAVLGLPVSLLLGTDSPRTLDTLIVDIPAGGSVHSRLSWTADQAGTDIPFQVVADPQDTFREKDETNNAGLGTITALAAAPEADLRITMESISFTPDMITVLPTVAEVLVVVENIGQSLARDVAVTLSSGGAEFASQIVSVPALSSVEVRFPVSITSGSDQLFTVTADPDDQIAEWRETNNQATAILPVAALHDFSVDSTQISVSPQPAEVGSPATVAALITNQGTASAYYVQVRFSVLAEGKDIDVATHTVDLPAGKSVPISFEWIPAVAGADLTFKVEVDPFQQYNEVSEANNLGTATIEIAGWSLPDLLLTQENLTLTPDPVLERGESAIEARVTNAGFAAAENVRVDYYLGLPDYGGELLGSVVVPQILADETVSTVFTWSDVQTSGEQLIHVVIDPENGIPEVDEANNTNFQTISIHSLPDLVVETGAIRMSPAIPTEGIVADVVVTVRNAGEQVAENVTVQLLDGFSVIAESVVPMIAGFSQQDAVLPFDTTGKEGVNPVTVQVDPAGVLLEKNKSNNSAEYSIAVQNANAWVTENYISPNGDGIQDRTNFYFRLDSPQSLIAQVVDAAGAAVRTMSDEAWENADNGQVDWDGLDDLGRVVDDGTYRIQVVDQDGTPAGSAQVVVDTNRTPITEAIGTPYLNTRILGERPEQIITSLGDESGYLFLVSRYAVNDKFPSQGLYFWEAESNVFELLTPPEWFSFPYEGSQLAYEASPDGSTIAISFTGYNSDLHHEEYGTLWILDRASGELRELDESRFAYEGSTTETNGKISYFRFSPDGKQITYLKRSVNWTNDLWIADVESGATAFLLENGDYRVEWGLQNNKFAFVGSSQVWTAQRTKNAVLPWTTPVSIDEASSLIGWSPDGSKLGYVKNINNFNNQVYVYEPATGSTLLYESESPYSTFEAWLNDGQIFYRDYPDNYYSAPPAYLTISVDDPTSEPITIIGANEWHSGVSLSSDREHLLFGDDNILRLIETKTGNVVFEVESPFIRYGWDDSLIDVFWDVLTEKLYIYGPTGRDSFWGPEGYESYYFNNHVLAVDLQSGSIRDLPVDSPTYSYSTNVFFDGGIFSAWYLYSEEGGAADTKGLFAFDPAGDGIGSNFDDHGNNDLKVTPLGSSLTYSSYFDSAIRLYRMQSLLNLVADVHSVKSRIGIEITGSAADLNFASYRLEYANIEDPENWTLLQTGAELPIVDETITTWAPPEEGVFELRLIAWDKAGNVSIDRSRVSWGESLTIANLSKSEDIISPDNDGSRDSFTLSYRVLAPIHLEFTVLNENNQVVRTVQKDHALIGRQSIVWDGKDENGVVVPDGSYQVSVFNYNFAVEVDRTPPMVSFTFTPVKVDFDTASVSSFLYASVDDKNLKRWVLERTVGTEPLVWEEYAWGDTSLTTENALRTFFGSEISANTGYQFRITAEDFAGNRSSSAPGVIPGRLVLFNKDSGRPDFSTGSLRSQGHHQLSVISTFGPALTNLQLECRIKDTWTTSTSNISETRGAMAIDWDSTSCGPYGNGVRLRGRSIDEQTIFSNELFYKDIFNLTAKCDGRSFIAENWLYEELIEYRAQYLLKGSGTWIDYFDLSSSEIGDFVISAPDIGHLPTDYRVRVVGRGAETGKFYQTEAVQGGNCNSQPDLLNRFEVAEVDEVVPAGSCGGTSTWKRFSFDLENFIVPVEMQVFLLTDTGEQLLGEMKADSNIMVNLGGLTDGYYSFKIVLEYIDQKTGSRGVVEKLFENYYLDITRPSVGISYPTDPVGYCPARSDELFDGNPAIPIEGWVSDDSGIRSYQVYYRKTAEKSERWLETGVFGRGTAMGGLGTWSPDSAEPGGYKLQLIATDQSGNRSCTESSFVIASTVPISSLDIDEDIISPNADGFKDSLQISYDIPTAAIVDLGVYSGEVLVRKLKDGVYHLGGTDTVVWDGKDDDGQIVSDGIYHIKLKSSNDCDYPDSREYPVEVHNTAPTLAFSSPQPEDSLGVVVEVSGTVEDPYLAQYRLEVGEGAVPVTWTTLAAGSKPVTNAWLANWNTYSLEGVWTFRLTSGDELKNRAETLLTVDLGERETFIKSLEAEPKIFSPNADGVSDDTTFKYELTTDCLVDVEITAAVGGKVAVRKSVDVLPAGVHAGVWDGINEITGEALPSGIYMLMLTATLPDNPNYYQQESISLQIDIDPPTVEITQPEESAYLNSTDVSLVGTIQDDHLSQYVIQLHSDNGSRTLTENSSNLENAELWTIPDLAEGFHTVEIEAVDELGNITVVQKSITVDRTPPVNTITTPIDGSYFGQAQEVVEIAGGIVETNPESFSLSYRPVGETQLWTELLSGISPENQQFNIVLDVGIGAGFADGNYELALVSRDMAGQEAETRVAFIVDNTLPEVFMDFTENVNYLKLGSGVVGSIHDDNLKDASLQFAKGTCGQQLQWSTLMTYRENVGQGRLFTWDALPADGDYCLKLVAEDRLSGVAETEGQVIIDTLAPTAPVINGKVENKINVQLLWEEPLESDLAGYLVYRNGELLSDGLRPDTGLLDEALDNGRYVYQIKAVDLAGNESAFSEPFEANIDLIVPLAVIISPLTGHFVHGEVAIKGTALSPDDFKEYRVYIGNGINPDSWSLIRRSPVPVISGVLSNWDTTVLPEAEYSIKLEAEDLSGNVSSCILSVTVDNTPPVAPVLLAADALGANVTITWSENTETDLSGYLLFRNDKLANATGAVIGEWAPYALDTTSYVDLDMVDGEHRYFVLAVDKAGNLSEQSNVLDLLIDLRPPHAAIVDPPYGKAFDQAVIATAESEDLDIASVQFQFLRQGDTVWQDIGSVLDVAPYEIAVDPEQLAWTYGSYYLRAVATDRSGLVDPNPGSRRVEYRDITPPATPNILTSSFSCKDITIVWSENNETDLAGYNVYRLDHYGDPVQMNVTILTSGQWSETVSSARDYTYLVSAVDLSGNESSLSEPLLFNLRNTYIDSGTETFTVDSTVNLTGYNAYPGGVVTLALNGATTRQAQADLTGNFVISDVELARGENIFTISSENEFGSSCASYPRTITYAMLLPAPEALSAGVSGLDIGLTWDPVNDPELHSYNIYRHGKQLNASIVVSAASLTATADSYQNENFLPAYAFDNNNSTAWRSAYNDGSLEPRWLQVDFEKPREIKEVSLSWGYNRGVDYEIQVWNGDSWEIASQITENSASENKVLFDSSFLTEKLRIYITSVNNSNNFVQLSEVAITEGIIVNAPQFIESLPQEGVVTYQVSSVNVFGIEGPLSQALEVTVGNGVPVSISVNLNISVLPEGESLALAWDSTVSDFVKWEIYRARNAGGPYERIGTLPASEKSLVDTGLINGETYFYVVTAVNTIENETAHSIETTGVPIDTTPPIPPLLTYPTLPGQNKVVYENTTDIKGSVEIGATVQLYKEGLLVGETQTPSSLINNTVQLDFSANNILLSPDGKFMSYLDWNRYNGALVIRDFTSNEELVIPEQFNSFSWTGNSHQVVFSYRDENYNSQIGFFNLEGSEFISVTGNSNAYNDYPSVSFDGNILVYVSNQNGSYDVWVKDLTSGGVRQISDGLQVEATAVSPDGNKVAYYDSREGTLYVTELNNGQTVEVDSNPHREDFEWSPDNRYLAYFSYSQGNKDIYVFDSIDGVNRQLSDIDISKYRLHWSSDSSAVIYQQDEADGKDEIRLATLSDKHSQLVADLNRITTLQWLSSGEVVYVDNNSNQLNYLTPPGFFAFDSVPLTSGENQFYATATDASGNISLSSDSIVVAYDTSRLPDIALSADRVFLFPMVPSSGESVVANIVLQNPSEISLDGIDVDFYLWDSQGEIRFLESQTVAHLGAGTSETVTISFIAPDQPGNSSLLILADPEDLIAELMESNNYISKDFQVSDEFGLKLSTALDGEDFTSHQVVDVSVDLLNKGSDFPGHIEISILDEGGYLVERLDHGSTVFEYGIKNFRFSWNTGTSFAGNYQVATVVSDEQGQVLAEQYLPFVILPNIQTSLEISTDRGGYNPNEIVRIEAGLSNVGDNNILSNMQLRTSIVDSTDQQVFIDEQSVVQLLPGMSSRHSYSWNTARTEPGVFRVVVDALLGEQVIASESTAFVIRPVVQLTGSLSVDPKSVVYGIDFNVPFTIENSGNQSANGYVRVSLLDPVNLEVVDSQDQVIDILMNSTVSRLFNFDTTQLDLKSYRVQMHFVDGSTEQLVGESSFGVVDGQSPRITVNTPEKNITYSQIVNFDVVALDDISGVASVSYRIDFGDWQTMPFADLATGRYVHTWQPVLADNGAHSIEYMAIDRAGNSTQTPPLLFELQMDNTPPVTLIEADLPYFQGSDGITYLADSSNLNLLATDDMSGVEKTEYHFDSDVWSLYDGSISLFALADGAHSVGFRSVDTLGNEEVETIFNFVVDNAAPVSTIFVDMQEYESDAPLYVPGGTELTLSAVDQLSGVARIEYRINHDVWTGYSPFVVTEEGEYRIEYRSVDQLGNIEDLKVLTLVVDTSTPVTTMEVGAPKYIDAVGSFFVTAATQFKLSAQDNLCETIIDTEYRVAGGEWVNYAPFNISVEGEYLVEYRSTDCMGHLEEANSLIVTIDNQAPTTEVYLDGAQIPFEGDTLYTNGSTLFELIATDFLSGVSYTEYRIDDGEWLLSAPFSLADEGEHLIEFRSVDNLGQLENPRVLSVFVDSSAPVSTISFVDQSGNASSNVTLIMANTQVVISANDTLSGVAAIYYRFDQEEVWKVYDGAFTLAGLNYGNHTIHYYSVDDADNAEEELSVDVVKIGIEVGTEVRNLPRVLVWTEDPATKETKNSLSYTLENIHSFVSEALTRPDAYFTIITDKDEFQNEFRSGSYNMVLILDQDVPFNAPFLREIRDAVDDGLGLLVSSWGNNVHPILQEIFGLDFNGSLPMSGDEHPIYLYPGVLSDGQTLVAKGGVLKTRLDGGSLAGVIPGEENCVGIRSVTLKYPVELAVGDQVSMTLFAEHDGQIGVVDEEHYYIDGLPVVPSSAPSGDPAGDIAIESIDSNGVAIRIAAPYGHLGDNYDLSLKIIHPSGNWTVPGQVKLQLTCGAHLQVGMSIPPFQITAVDEDNDTASGDVPAVILGNYGDGKSVFLSYNIVESALYAQWEEQAKLLTRAAGYLLPETTEATVGSIMLLETRISAYGNGMSLLSSENLDAGLSYLPMFGLEQEHLDFRFHLDSNEDHLYYYFVRIEDTNDDIGKETEIFLDMDAGPSLFQRYHFDLFQDGDFGQ